MDIPTKTMTEGVQHFDCLIIGAGICGIDAAYHVQKYSPWANYAVLERSANIGGTWDQIKYPGRLYVYMNLCKYLKKTKKFFLWSLATTFWSCIECQYRCIVQSP